jgi:hypothetical protein
MNEITLRFALEYNNNEIHTVFIPSSMHESNGDFFNITFKLPERKYRLYFIEYENNILFTYDFNNITDSNILIDKIYYQMHNYILTKKSNIIIDDDLNFKMEKLDINNNNDNDNNINYSYYIKQLNNLKRLDITNVDTNYFNYIKSLDNIKELDNINIDFTSTYYIIILDYLGNIIKRISCKN